MCYNSRMHTDTDTRTARPEVTLARTQEPNFRPATTAQYAFLKVLIRDRDTTAVAERVEADRAWAVAGALSVQDASALIDLLKACPRKSETSPVKIELTAGVYRDGAGTLYKVYPGKRGALLVKRADTADDRLTFEYVGAANRVAQPDWKRLDVSEVGSLGKVFGVCVVCSRTLTDPVSVESGIGPVCAGRYGN